MKNTATKIDLNPMMFTAKLNGKDICLTATEYRLFEALMRNKGRVCTRSVLMDALYDLPPGPSRVVDVYVGYLRRKLGRDVIRTRRGFGYYIP